MPELPEIEVLCRDIRRSLKGLAVRRIEIRKPNICDISERKFNNRVKNSKIVDARPHGKWAFMELDSGAHILINNSMGANMLYVNTDKINSDGRYEAAIYFDNDKALRIKYWWLYGKVLYSDGNKEPTSHPLIKGLGIHAYGRKFTLGTFSERIAEKKGRIKQVLLDQKSIAGIGNAYIHDIMFRARIHPFKNANKLSDSDVESLYNGIKETFTDSIKRGGAFWEMNIYGKKGRFDTSRLLIGYKEGKPCPECGTGIKKIKTGSTTGFICPKCQKL